MKEYQSPRTTRKRRRNNSTRKQPPRGSPQQQASAWSSLLWMFAAAAIASSSPSSSDASWVVRGETHDHHDPNAGVRVRGGRGSEGRGFVRQHQQRDDGNDSKDNDDDDDDDDEYYDDDEDEDEDEDIDPYQHDFFNDDDNVDNLHDNNNSNENNNNNSEKNNSINSNTEDANHDELSNLLLSKDKLRSSSSSRRREENDYDQQHQQQHQQQQQQQQQQQHDDFLEWCQDSLGIDVGLVEIDHFGYPDYLRAMEDRIDIFCDDCDFDDEDNNDNNYDFIEGDNDNDNDNDNNSNTNDTDEKNGLDSFSTDSFGNGKFISVEDEDRYLSVSEEYPPVSVRGLKASRDIHVGEVVLSIPHGALWTVHNAIDVSGDPRLVEAMGPEARQRHGWESPGMDEIPLLAITLLYHMEQAASSSGGTADTDNNIVDRPDHGPYLEILGLEANKLEGAIPHLWSSRKLRKSATPSVRRVAKGIRKDVVDLYESIVLVLIENHPGVFGKDQTRIKVKDAPAESKDDVPEMVKDAIHDHGLDKREEEDANDEDEWMFSLEKFHWAFALVNSRHWHLQIPDDPSAAAVPEEGDDFGAEPRIPPTPSPDLDVDSAALDGGGQDPGKSNQVDDETNEEHESFADQEGPPAATPTDEWVVVQNQKLREEEKRETKRNEEGGKNEGNNIINNNNNPPEVSSPPGETNDETSDDAGSPSPDEVDHWPAGNSFLAPLADLLNFGPPCTRGIYNHVTNAFEIVATCEFRKGQEITFWYADACEDVFVANYGFTMPMMVHKCDELTTNENRSNGNNEDGVSSAVWQQQQQEQQQQYLEDELLHAYQELDRLDRRLAFLMNVVEDCHCGNQTELLAGAWGYDGDESDESSANNSSNEIETDAENRTDGSDGATPTNLPHSPSPPTKSNGNSIGGRADAKHAIRDGGGRRQQQPSPQQQQPQRQKPQHRRHHHQSMTRTRSRRHQGRMNEF